MNVLVLAVQPLLRWRTSVRRAWLLDAPVMRWGLPVGFATLGFSLGVVGLGWGDRLSAQQAQLRELKQSNAAKQSLWVREAPMRAKAQAVSDSVLAWQSALRWTQSAPWLAWPEDAQQVGVTLQRIKPVSIDQTADLVRHRVALQGEGQLIDVDALWRKLGRQGWWITVENMRMEVSGEGRVSWHAQWALHQALPADAPLPASSAPGPFLKEPWVNGWLAQGGPSIAVAHAGVPVAPEVSLHERWALAGLNPVERAGAVVPSPWPRTDWAQMRLVGRWVRGQQVVALVAVGGVVHAVVPGMRLGPQQHEVVQVTMDGVWVSTTQAEARPRRVLHWSNNPALGGS